MRSVWNLLPMSGLGGGARGHSSPLGAVPLGELIAPRPADIDTTKRLIRVMRSSLNMSGGITRRLPKNNKTRRPYPLRSCDIVRRIAEVRVAAGPDVQEVGQVEEPRSAAVLHEGRTAPPLELQQASLHPSENACWPADLFVEEDGTYRQWKWSWYCCAPHTPAIVVPERQANGGLT